MTVYSKEFCKFMSKQTHSNSPRNRKSDKEKTTVFSKIKTFFEILFIIILIFNPIAIIGLLFKK